MANKKYNLKRTTSWASVAASKLVGLLRPQGQKEEF